MSNLVSGALIGSLDNQGFLRKTLLLGVLIACTNSIIHWSVGQFGVSVDFGAAGETVLLAIIVMPICIALSMLGGALGALIYRVVWQRKRS